MIQLDLRKISPSKEEREPLGTERVIEFSKRNLPTLTILIILLLGVGFKAAYSYRIDRAVQASTGDRKPSGYHSRELAGVEALYIDHQSGTQSEKRQVEMIEQLRKSQRENRLSKDASMKDPKAVWLSSVKDEGVSVSIQGTAFSADGVATLISDLQTTGYFKNIEVRETYQDDKRNKRAFEFELTCEFEGNKS
jgi:Tfp pilus assembly protein PilN